MNDLFEGCNKMFEKIFKESDFIYWGLLLLVGAPVLVFGIFIILSFIMFGIGLSPEEFNLLLIVKAVCFGGGILLIICGNFYRRNFFSAVLGIIAFASLFIQIMPSQIVPTGLDIALDLPGLALVFIALAVWLPEIRTIKLTRFIIVLCSIVFAYQLFVILAIKFIPYALPSFLQTYSWVKLVGSWGTWFVYFSLILKLITQKTDIYVNFIDYGYLFKYFLGTVTAAFLISIILITCIFVQLEEGTAVIEFTLDSENKMQNIDVLLPIPCNVQGPLVSEKKFKIYNKNNKLIKEADLNIEDTEYGKMLHLILNNTEKGCITLRGELKSKKLGWHLGKERVPVVLSPRLSEDEGVNTLELPMIPEHHNSLYTAVYLTEGIKNINYCFELIVRGIELNSYQQVFSSYLPLNYTEGYKLKKGWNSIPMIEEIFVR